jgi:O-succinylbenzoate synthase
VTAAAELGACRIINVKVSRTGGHTESIRLHDEAKRRGLGAWCGAMLETGIGKAHNMALAALPHFTYPNDIYASSRHFHEDLVEPEIEVGPAGRIRLPQGPGIGYQIRRKALEDATVFEERFRAA